MKLLHVTVALTCLATAMPAFAQQADAAAGQSILEMIPAGAMGFVSVGNIKSATANVDGFLAATGLKELTGLPPMLELITQSALLGEGFNPAGGFAAVMLDWQQFGFKPAMMAGPAEQEPVALPMVLYVPGSGIKEVFGAYKIESAGKYSKVGLRMGEVFAATKGGYVMLSPNEKALTAALEAAKSAQGELDKDSLRIAGQSDLFMHVNMQLAGPVITDALKQTQQMMMQVRNDEAKFVASLLPIYMKMIEQLQQVSLAGRFVASGVVMDEIVAYKPDSPLAKAAAAAKDVEPAVLLNRLPDLSYVLAMGTLGGGTGPELVQLKRQVFEALLQAAEADVSEEVKTQLHKLTDDVSDQITGLQFVVGQAPPGSGLVATATIVQCKDSAKMMALMQDSAALAGKLLPALLGPEAAGLQVTYEKGAQTVAEMSVDAITLSHPDLVPDTPDERDAMIKILGQDKITILLAAPDKDLVVATFGGSSAMLAEAVKVAKASAGAIGKSAELAEPLKYMPAKLNTIVLFNGANFWNMMVAIGRAFGEEPPPFSITARTPVAGGAAIVDGKAHVVLYVPNELIRNGVDAFKSFMRMFMPPTVGMPPEEAF